MLIGLAHGSRHARVAEGIESVLATASRLAGVETRAAYLDLTDPDLEAVSAEVTYGSVVSVTIDRGSATKPASVLDAAVAARGRP